MSDNIDQINGTRCNVRELFTGRPKYDMDYYQREYTWDETNIVELLDDLSTRFLDEWHEAHARHQVGTYRPYFLGPIVTNNRGDALYIVDGQQRLTTLTLLLIFLKHLQEGRTDAVEVELLVYSTKFGEQTFNIDVKEEPERETCMRAILNRLPFDPSGHTETVRNLWQRYQDIERLPFFIDWLLERVMVVEITTGHRDLAVEMFETMNDRGQRLTATDMLKRHLLSNFHDPEAVSLGNALWRRQTTALDDIERNASAEFFKNWLRGKFAETIRERRKDATPGDFDVIGTAFHKWVRDKAEQIGLRKPDDYKTFVNHDLGRLSRRYKHLLEVSRTFTPGFEHVFYNTVNGFTLQLQTILAAVTPTDDDETFQTKTRMVAGYLDLFVARRMVSYKNFGYSTVSYAMFNLAKDLRDLDVEELATTLGWKVAELPESFDAVTSYALHQRNGSHVRYLLARITAWLDERCDTKHSFTEYVDRARRYPYEIEHIWANKPEQHPELTGQEFAARRDRLGDLLLLPKDFNASYGDRPYAEKLSHYFSHNLLVRSLDPKCYQNNPAFRQVVDEFGLPFRPYPEEFTSAALDERQQLYRRLCELVWDPAELGLVLPDISGDQAARTQHHYNVSIRQLGVAGILPAGTKLTGRHGSRRYTAEIAADYQVLLPEGSLHTTPSGAAKAALHKENWNGWTWWHAELPEGSVLLATLRERFGEPPAQR